MEKITNIRGKLLEGCIWDDHNECVYFTDIEDSKIYKLGSSGNRLNTVGIPGKAGCITLDDAGKLYAALPDGIYEVDMETGKMIRKIPCILEKGMRFNDGKADLCGNFWVGSMYESEEQRLKKAEGSLYCIQNGRIRVKYDGFMISNGLDWDKSGKYMYHIDTPTKKINEYSIRDNIHITAKRTALDLSDEQGVPDGMCVDDDGFIWVAMWGGSSVLYCNPGNGKILNRIQVPVPLVSCCTFGGHLMKDLYITTAGDGKNEGYGEIYLVHTETKGVPCNRIKISL